MVENVLRHPSLPELAGHGQFVSFRKRQQQSGFRPIFCDRFESFTKLRGEFFSERRRIEVIQLHLFGNGATEFPVLRRLHHHGDRFDVLFDTLDPCVRLAMLHVAEAVDDAARSGPYARQSVRVLA